MNLFYSLFLTLILSTIVIGSAYASESEESQTRHQEHKFEAQIVKTVLQFPWMRGVRLDPEQFQP